MTPQQKQPQFQIADHARVKSIVSFLRPFVNRSRRQLAGSEVVILFREIGKESREPLYTVMSVDGKRQGCVFEREVEVV